MRLFQKEQILSFLRLLSFLLLIIGIQACSTELEVNAPYRETKVLYGVLDPTLPYQTVRIGRGFLSEGRSALDIAKNSPDSSLFKPSNLEVQLFEIKLGTNGRFDTTQRILFYADTILNKETSGDFFAPEQLVFRTPAVQLDTNTRADLLQYLIRVRNKISGKVSEATTRIPGKELNIRNWAAIGLTDKGPFSLDFGSKKKTTISINKSVNTAVVQLSLNWKMRVITTDDTLEEIWKLSSGIENDIQGDQKEIIFGAGSFWSFIQGELSKRDSRNVISRRFLPSTMEVYAGNKDYDNYRVVNGNYNAITQSQPVYSNVSNDALGIFCGRNQRRFAISLDRVVIDTLQVRFPELKLIK